MSSEPTIVVDDPDLAPPVCTDPNRRFFHVDEEGCVFWWVIARDLGHAKEILREMAVGFGQDGVFLDEAERQGLLEWSELSPEAVAKIRRCTRDDGETRPLADCEMGDSFCSEY